MRSRLRLRTLTLFLFALLAGWQTWSSNAAPEEGKGSASGPGVTELFRETDPNDASKDIVLLSVKFGPGLDPAPHRHPGFLVGYVLSGEFDFQLEGQPLQHLKTGDRFYEPPGAVHLVSRNPGRETTEVLAFCVQPKGQPAVLPVH